MSNASDLTSISSGSPTTPAPRRWKQSSPVRSTLTYVGTGPALNAHFKSNGEEIRVISGAANGGAALVVKPDGGIKAAADFRGQKIATPQLGNTQDIACRAWLKAQGYRVTQTGGDVLVIPTSNPDQLSLLQSGGVDAVWTVEPWVTRLEKEANAKVFLEDRDVITTWLVSSSKFLKEHRDLAKKIAAANRELTAWIKAHPAEAQKDVGGRVKGRNQDGGLGGYDRPFTSTNSPDE